GEWAKPRGPDPGEGRSEVCPPEALLPCLALAGVCWYLTFTASAWAWAHVPGLPLLQFPWRLHGPLGILLAIAGAGALASLLALLERRRGAMGQWAAPAITALAIGGVLVN